MRLMYNWLVANHHMRDWWKYVSMESGVQYVITGGIPEML